MMSALCHNSVKISQQNAFAAVEFSRSELRPPCSVKAIFGARFFPRNAAVSPIKIVRRIVNASKVRDSVVRFFAIDVVNYFGLFAVMQKPANAVRSVLDAFVLNGQIAKIIKSSRLVANSDFCDGSHLPNQIAGFGIVGQDIANVIWDNFKSHCVPLYVMDRGAVASTTVTPILTRGEI